MRPWRWIIVIVFVLSAFGSPLAAIGADECLYFYPFQSNEGGYLVDLDQSEIFPIEPPPSPSHQSAEDMHSSPDGQYGLALRSTILKTLTLIDFDTGAQTPLAEQAWSPAWSPDSTWLAYVEAESSQDTHPDLVLYNVKTAEATRTAIETFDGLWGVSINWVPDSSRLILSHDFSDKVAAIVSFYSIPDLALIKTLDPITWPIYMNWSPSGQMLILGSEHTGTFGLIDMQDKHFTFRPVLLESQTPYYFYWSADEQWLIAYHTMGDLADGLNLVTRQGEVVLQDIYVPGHQYDFVPRHDWIGDQRLLVNIWDNGFDGLTLFDLATGKATVLLANIGSYDVSSDQRLVVVKPLSLDFPPPPALEIRFFDLSESIIKPARTITLESEPGQLLWRQEKHELIVLFDDGLLRGYDYDTDTWRSIATLPADERWSIERVECSAKD